MKTHHVIPSRLHSPLFVVSSSLSLTYEGVRPRRFLVAASMAKRMRLGIIWGLTIAIILLVNAPGPSLAADTPEAGSGEGVQAAAPDRTSPLTGAGERYTLDSIIRYALKNNPRIRIAGRDVETETYGVDAAKADRMPRLDLGAGFTRYAYDTPLAPVVIVVPNIADSKIPDFRRNIWDTGLTVKLPLFRGGRLMRGVMVAEMRKAVAEDMLKMTRQDIVYNLTSVYCKIAQLDKLLLAYDASVKQTRGAQTERGALSQHGHCPPPRSPEG